MQNDDRISINDLSKFQDVEDELFGYHKGHFAHEIVMDDGTFNSLISQQRGKPYYIPPKDELLKYADDLYYEKTNEFKKLKVFVQKNLVKDAAQAEELCDDIQLVCSMNFSMETVMNEFNRRDVVFENEAQINKLMPLIIELSNNVRIWENNGHTPNEIFNTMERPNLRPLPNNGAPNLKVIAGGQAVDKMKVGRNDPCPCGSGKKYKKCCLNNGTGGQVPCPQ